MRYLSKNEIIFVNKRTIVAHGGNYNLPQNFLNEGQLDYLIEVIASEIFGVPLYPKLSDKAGLYMYNIIANHVFSDGNKRTGLEAAILFLDLNGYRINKKLPKVEIFEFTIKVASGISSLTECQAWFETNILQEYL
ncbi:MAG: type II toxin-antitoxin system death-on-curing family toxin [Chitinophagaceae bacterium]|jgi:death-on-curing protein|nr:type II toxin-antitoxin system death-on-curing family toxin [Chitinophagaceae bacterium]MCU0384274.1 type II toxin-antitoxin system death-on-curing family toxin [Cyclobacteriaceae bacterium]